MIHRLILRSVACAAMLLSGAVCAAAQSDVPDPVIEFQGDDPVMNAAIEHARATLPQFWAAMDGAPNATNFALKVAVPISDGGSEHIWMNAPQRLGDGRYVGIIGNKPVDADLTYGAPYEFGEDEITDWVFIRDGLIEGGQTIRALLPRMEKQEAEALRAQLAPMPDL